MESVLIVDDEFEIREGLRTLFPWPQYGVDEIWTAEDGHSALAKAEEHSPSLIITDIKMNRMSGLDFLQALRDRGHAKCKTIVISGYDDFELVRQAMTLGAIDYVLKPINTAELTRTIAKALDEIRQDNRAALNRKLLESQVQYALPKMKEELLREMTEVTYHPYSELRLKHRLHNLQLTWMLEAHLSLMMVEVDDFKAIRQPGDSGRKQDLILFSIGNIVQDCWDEGLIVPYTLHMDSRGRWVVVYSCGNEAATEQAAAIAGNCIARVNQYVKVKASVGLWTAAGDWKALAKMYQAASDLLEQKAVYGGNRILADIGTGSEDDMGGMSLANPAEVFDLIRYGTEDDIRAVIQTFDEMVRGWATTHIRDTQQRLFEWLLELYKKSAALGYDNKEWKRNPLAIWERLEQYDTLESLRTQTEAIIMDIAGQLGKQANPQSHIISDAIRYIDLHYMDNLTLQSVAAEVHVTPVWLSKLFRKEQGRTFLDYLTDVRMAKAKELLGDNRFKIYQVAQDVGYKDPVYFSKAFRKYAGHTPKEYRNLRGIYED